MKGSRRLLESSTDDRSAMLRDAMDKAAEQALRAGQIIRRLRDFVARGESERRVESVKKLIEEASALALVGAKDQGVRVRFQFDPAVDLVLADKVQIQQVLLNLIRNAIEAMEGSQKRELIVSTLAADGDMIADQRHRHRLRHCARNDVPAVSAFRHHQAPRHGRGPVDLAHDRGGAWRKDRGRTQSRRRNDLPLHAPRRVSERISAMPSDQAVVHVIDDDEAVRQSLAFLLGTAGIEVQTYDSAVAFLKVAAEVKPGCVITDVRMPELSGIDLLRRLKELKLELPVIVITGHGDVPLAVEAMKIGAADFLEKPFDDEVLLASVRSALNQQDRDSRRQAERAEIEGRLAALSNRERDVLDGLVAGHANKQIAFDLGISPRTVEIYRANLMTKMQAASLSDLVRMALIAGILGALPDGSKV